MLIHPRMRPQGILDYIELGMRTERLVGVRASHRFTEVLLDLNRVSKALQDLGLRISTQAFYESKLEWEMDELSKRLMAEPVGSAAPRDLGQVRAAWIAKGATEFKTVLVSESALLAVYWTTTKRYGINDLTDCVDKLMSPGILDALPYVAIVDFQEAGKCIAFDRPTAAAFHLLRGTEAMVRLYHQKWTKSPTMAQQPWGPLIDALRRLPQGPPKPPLDAVDNIRHNYRNPTQHPEKVYTIEEAQDLWGVCVDAVTRMVQTLPP